MSVRTDSVTVDDDTRVVFDDRGSGAPLVLVHGITEARAAWDPVTGTLAEQWRVVRIDQRGHGESDRQPPYDPVTMADDVAAVVRALELADPLVVGHSMGGVVATAYGGAGHPARGIVNVDQPLELGGFQDALAPLEPMLRDPEQFADAVRTVFAVLDGPLPASERARLDALSSPESDVVLGMWDPVLTLPAEELDAMVSLLLRAIRVPYLAIHGSDPGVEYVQWLLARVSNARLEVWPDHGHYPHLIEPDRFVERLDQFDGGL
ncbi:MAG: alpha/beta fold hydrolase [Acidimicrobiia bacterium]